MALKMGQTISFPTAGMAGFDRFLYAIVTVDDPKFVKFGIAKSPKKRFSSIQTGCPLDLRLEATIPHTIGLEDDVHANLKRFSVRGEWYHGCDEILRAVEIMKGGDSRLLGDYVKSLYYSADPDTPDQAYWGDRGEVGSLGRQLSSILRATRGPESVSARSYGRKKGSE